MSLEFARARFERAKQIAAATGKGAPQTAKIRIAVPFVKGQNFYDIDIKDGKGHITNRALLDNDKFVCRAIALGIMVEDDLKKGHAPTLSYPLLKSAAVTAAGLKGLDNADAHVIYNGDWSLRTNQEVNYQQFPASLFLRVPDAQPANVYGSNVEHAAYEMPEEVVLSGKEEHKIRIEYPGNATTDIKGEAGSTAFLVFELFGWTIQGAAK